MKCKLINPPIIGMLLHQSTVCLPLGLCIIKGYFKEKNVHLPLDDLNAMIRYADAPLEHKNILKALELFENTEIAHRHYTGIKTPANRKLAERIAELTDVQDYDIIGIRINSYKQALPALLLAEILKEKYSKTIILGGPYVTLFAEDFFKKYSFIDYAIIGPGEVPLFKLLDHLNGKIEIDEVPSLYARDNNRITVTPRYPSNIEDQVLPDYDDLQISHYEQNGLKLTPYLFSRGCANSCAFCIFKNVTPEWEIKSVDKVIADIKQLKEKYGFSYIWFEDPNFNTSAAHVEQLCDRLIEENIDIQWGARAQSKGLDERILRKMKAAGCTQLQWGLETASDSMMSKMNKQTAVAEATRIYTTAFNLGIKNKLYIMFRYPYETLEDLSSTIDYIKKHARIIDALFIYQFVLFYGADIYNTPEHNNLKINPLKNSFYSYIYAFDELERKNSHAFKKKKEKLVYKLFDNQFRYIVSKQAPFPLSICIRLFGYKPQIVLLHLVLFIYHSRFFNSFRIVRKHSHRIAPFAARFTPVMIKQNRRHTRSY